MKKRNLSTLGFLMEKLNIPTVSLSRTLHVDASLVSKWRSGDRTLNSQSIYFEDVLSFLLVESKKTNDKVLHSALLELYPLEQNISTNSLQTLLRQALLTVQTPLSPVMTTFKSVGNTTQVQTFENNAGRRQAIEHLLDCAEQMNHLGHITFFDSEEYAWLIEDDEFAKSFATRMNILLAKGFKATFVIHFSSYRERFVKFFEACNLLLFHRNASWYYYEYYDENVFHFSLFTLDKAFSLLGLSSSQSTSFTMLFSDPSSIIQHSLLASSAISRCQKLFVNFEPRDCENVLEYIRIIRKRGVIYSYLPAPVFVSTSMDLLKQILEENNIAPHLMERCFKINIGMHSMLHSQFRGLENTCERIIQIFQYEEMENQILAPDMDSLSLTLLGAKNVKITKLQYAATLRHLVITLKKYDNYEIVLLSKKDGVHLPSIREINCWCKQNTWMVQMDHQGFRISDEVSIVNAASITFEKCLRKIPPERKEKGAVIRLLLELAQKMES